MGRFTYVAQLPAAAYGTTGLAQWIKDNVITLVILLLAITVLWAARGGNVSKGITVLVGLIMGLAVLGLATGNNSSDLADFVISLFKTA